MSKFYEDENGQPRYALKIDFNDEAVARFPKKLVLLVLDSLSAFLPFALSDRSYDVQAMTGPLWDKSHISHVLLGQIVSSLALLPDFPLESIPDSPRSRKRYKFIH